MRPITFVPESRFARFARDHMSKSWCGQSLDNHHNTSQRPLEREEVMEHWAHD